MLQPKTIQKTKLAAQESPLKITSTKNKQSSSKKRRPTRLNALIEAQLRKPNSHSKTETLRCASRSPTFQYHTKQAKARPVERLSKVGGVVLERKGGRRV